MSCDNDRNSNLVPLILIGLALTLIVIVVRGAWRYPKLAMAIALAAAIAWVLVQPPQYRTARDVGSFCDYKIICRVG